MIIVIMWLFASAISLWALAVNVNAEDWGLSAVMLLVCVYNGTMLFRSVNRPTF